MNKDNLARMSAKEIDEYARALGIAKLAGKTAEQKAKALCGIRERTATVSALGLDLEIPIKRMQDKRVTDLLAGPTSDDASYERAVELILGEEQYAALIEACTEEDGTVDTRALALAFSKILNSDELKNF